MNNLYIDGVKESFGAVVRKNCIIGILRDENGFVSDDAYVKRIVSTIALHSINNLSIFNTKQYNNLISILNKIKYE